MEIKNNYQSPNFGNILYPKTKGGKNALRTVRSLFKHEMHLLRERQKGNKIDIIIEDFRIPDQDAQVLVLDKKTKGSDARKVLFMAPIDMHYCLAHSIFNDIKGKNTLPKAIVKAEEIANKYRS